MIRKGLDCDIPEIVDLAREFWKHTIYEEPFDPDLVAEIAKSCIENDLMAVIDEDGVKGFICAVKSPLLASTAALTATEVAWWVDPDYRKGRQGIALLKYMEQLVKSQGVKYWNMVSMQSSSPETAEKIYERMGYRKTETSYTKVI